MGSKWGNMSDVDHTAPDWEYLYNRAVSVMEQFDVVTTSNAMCVCMQK
jgi:hypothetical protein